MADLADHPFSPENIAYELGGDTAEDRRWYRYVAAVEAGLGHSVDGIDDTEAGEGYSLDECYDWFANGDTADSYVAEVKSRPRYKRDVEAETFANHEAHERFGDRCS